MAERAALVTGASSGIGLAISRALAEDGYAITASARRPQKLEEAVAGLAADGFEVTAVPADVSSEDDIKALVAAHREKYGRLDVLVNNAGVGIGGAVEEAETKKIDMQIDVNLRSYVIAMREALPMLKEAGAEHGKALIVNTASIAGKGGQGWLAVYSATKAGVIGLSQATQMEVGKDGVQVTALCPAFVDTPMTEWVQGQVKPEEMIQPEDLAETVRLLLRTSRYCLIPEVVFSRPGDPSAFAT
ncbi:MAG: SDR family oxidoreductase [Solirubrobacterales bacterium]|nr:SDR family oxidoreductase [Solirubrobacterales bacterium]MCB8969997.1 SDR family oxidoreductase [Thermoleophilales bacterium]